MALYQNREIAGQVPCTSRVHNYLRSPPPSPFFRKGRTKISVTLHGKSMSRYIPDHIWAEGEKHGGMFAVTHVVGKSGKRYILKVIALNTKSRLL